MTDLDERLAFERGRNDGRDDPGPRRRNLYAEWRKANPEPDLQALAARHGGLGNVPREAWAEHEVAREDWLARYRERPRGNAPMPIRRPK